MKNGAHITSAIANAVGRDAGNASMAKAGRKRWNLSDFQAAMKAAKPLWDMLNSAKP